MANIHAINAQGTEYGITAENGITQEQVDAIATIGDATDLETAEKTTLVGAVNEINEKLPSETVIYENPNPINAQDSFSLTLSGLTNAKALKITHGRYSAQYGALKEDTFPLQLGVLNEFYLSQTFYNDGGEELSIQSRYCALSASRLSLDVSNGQLFSYDMNEERATAIASSSAEKIIKIVAIF